MSIHIVPHDSSWYSQFLAAAEEIRRACSAIALLLFHIGSTSISGLAAKPVIDILGEVEDLDDIDACRGSLVTLGFDPLGEFGMVQRRFFKRLPMPDFPCAIHLHVFAAGDPQIERHLRFRDYLRAHPSEAKKYEELKQSLASVFTNDREGYNEGKNSQVQELDRKALLWPSAPAHPHLNPIPRLKKWTKAKILDSMEANLYFHMTHLVRYVPDAEFFGRNSLSWVSTPVSDDTFNYALHAHLQPQETDFWIEHTISYYQSKNLPFSWWIKPSDEPKNLSERLRERGFVLSELHKGMFAEIQHLPQLSHSLNIERILTPESLFDFCSIAQQLGLSKELYSRVWKQIPPSLYQKGTPIEIYVGYANGIPAVSGLLAFYGRVAGIYWIATIPTERGKGHASEMMRFLLQRAFQEKYQIAVLLASSVGEKLYRKFGFSFLADFYEYRKG